MRNRLNEWRQQRKEQAAEEAAEASTYFEGAEAAELHRLYVHAHNTYDMAIKECHLMGEQASKRRRRRKNMSGTHDLRATDTKLHP